MANYVPITLRSLNTILKLHKSYMYECKREDYLIPNGEYDLLQVREEEDEEDEKRKIIILKVSILTLLLLLTNVNLELVNVNLSLSCPILAKYEDRR